MKQTILPESIVEEISNAGGNLSRVARAFGIDYHALKALANSGSQMGNHQVVERPEDWRDLAKPTLRNFAVAVRKHGAEWPVEFSDAISQARKAYDGGSHEMCQGSNSGWVILYSIPRLVRTRTRTYFSTMEVW